MYFVDENTIENNIETGDLVKHDADNKLFIAIHDDQLCQWYIIGLDGTIGEHIKVYAELRAYYTLIAKSEDLKLTIEK